MNKTNQIKQHNKKISRKTTTVGYNRPFSRQISTNIHTNNSSSPATGSIRDNICNNLRNSSNNRGSPSIATNSKIIRNSNDRATPIANMRNNLTNSNKNKALVGLCSCYL